jgi:hypothetical protein
MAWEDVITLTFVVIYAVLCVWSRFSICRFQNLFYAYFYNELCQNFHVAPGIFFWARYVVEPVDARRPISHQQPLSIVYMTFSLQRTLLC